MNVPVNSMRTIPDCKSWHYEEIKEIGKILGIQDIFWQIVIFKILLVQVS